MASEASTAREPHAVPTDGTPDSDEVSIEQLWPPPLIAGAPVAQADPLPVFETTVESTVIGRPSLGPTGTGAPLVINLRPPPHGTAHYPIVVNSQVGYFLDRFTRERRDIISAWLGRSGRFMSMIRDTLKRHGLPEDLAFTAMIESGFNPVATSRAGARGLWQFMAATAKRYGLRVDHWVDERLDPEKSTVAAAAYLRDLYELFGSWFLAQAAYNAGEAAVARAIRLAGSSDFWALTQTGFLHRETKEFVPQIVAAVQIGREPHRFGFEPVQGQFSGRRSRGRARRDRPPVAVGFVGPLQRSPAGPESGPVERGHTPGRNLRTQRAGGGVIPSPGRSAAATPDGPPVPGLRIRARVEPTAKGVHVVRQRDTVPVDRQALRGFRGRRSALERPGADRGPIRPGDRLRVTTSPRRSVRVEVRAFATLRVFLPPGDRHGSPVDVPEGSTIRDVARALGIADETALVALLNGREADPEQPVTGGDVVTLFPPLAGG